LLGIDSHQDAERRRGAGDAKMPVTTPAGQSLRRETEELLNARFDQLICSEPATACSEK
jgi:hypothetical protein